MRGTAKMLSLAVLTLSLVACGDDMAPPPPVDTGVRDSDPVDDTGVADTGVMDSGDVGPMDSATPDASGDATTDTLMDSGMRCMATDRCSCPMEGISCEGGCPTGTTCLSNTCGEMFCFAAGGRCNSDADCPGTSSCMTTDDGDACLRGSAGCADSRECPVGFACEAGSCVDRRVPCVNNVDCPWGYACAVGLRSQGSFCEYVARACADLDACFTPSGVCRDFDGDGDTECGGNSAPSECPATACSGNDACGTDPTLLRSSCGDYGPCQSACNGGFTCVDAWGDGQGECVPTGGSCTTNADCPERQVCAPPNGGGAPACQAGNLG
jgi:hypothetical protein